jgi:hypothetical protein
MSSEVRSRDVRSGVDFAGVASMGPLLRGKASCTILV